MEYVVMWGRGGDREQVVFANDSDGEGRFYAYLCLYNAMLGSNPAEYGTLHLTHRGDPEFAPHLIAYFEGNTLTVEDGNG